MWEKKIRRAFSDRGEKGCKGVLRNCIRKRGRKKKSNKSVWAKVRRLDYGKARGGSPVARRGAIEGKVPSG